MTDPKVLLALSLGTLVSLVALLVGAACAQTSTPFAECVLVAGIAPAICLQLAQPIRESYEGRALVGSFGVLWIACVLVGFAAGGGAL